MPSRFVQSVQSYLEDDGFNPGPLDGVIGKQTVAAWNLFLDKQEDEYRAKTATPVATPAAPVGAPGTGALPVAVSETDKVVTGIATCFGLQYGNGQKDPGDNGKGAWGANTANETIVGVSLPEGVMISTFGFSGTWAQNAENVGKFLGDNKIQVAVTRAGKTIVADVVDAGPAREYRGKLLHNAIDLTYALAHSLETNGEAVVSYQIIKDNQPMVILGWDRLNGCEIAQAGVA
jgi:peptidoglycan hydrolase-like protein with peptidoglycan-binding domain